MEANTHAQGSNRPVNLLGRYVPLLVWLAVIVAILWTPLGITRHGYLPTDDALRHAAKAVTAKQWPDVLLLADWVKTDHNSGWHAVLGAVHRVTGWGPEGLVVFSVEALFALFCLLPLIWVRRPEAWLAVVLIISIGLQTLLIRLTYGRPLTLSAAILMALLFLWRRPALANPPWARWVVSTLFFAAAAWIHGSWYLFALLVIAFALAGQWRNAASICVCWLVGALLGGLATGHPFAFLWQSIDMAKRAFSEKIPEHLLVVEFRPGDGDFFALVIVALVLIWKCSKGKSLKELVFNPAFLLMVLSWVLGVKVVRFWLDWGLPAMLCWLAWQFEEPIEQSLPRESVARLGITAGLALALVFSTGSNLGFRWTSNFRKDFISASDPETAGWFPPAGGTIYNAQMGVFFRTFYTNPNGDWRYILGFEPVCMPAEDLAIYRGIQKNPEAEESFEPWVKKMRPADRMVIERATMPPISRLEWRRFGNETWFGRLPGGGSPRALESKGEPRR